MPVNIFYTTAQLKFSFDQLTDKTIYQNFIEGFACIKKSTMNFAATGSLFEPDVNSFTKEMRSDIATVKRLEKPCKTWTFTAEG